MKHRAIAPVVAVLASVTIALGLWAVGDANTLPNISGRWYANGNAGHRCHISQSGNSVSLTNERGATATGSFTDPSTLSTNWGPFGGGSITGRISGDLQTISWSNGTSWSRVATSTSSTSSTSTSSFTTSARSAPAATATPKPYWYLRWASPKGPPAPIDYVDAWTAVKRDGTAGWTCLSFKNTAGVAATQVYFSFLILNRDHDVIDSGHLDRKGTFSPGVEIHGYHNVAEWAERVGPRAYRDNCVSWDPEGEPRALQSYLHGFYYTIRVKRIEYADGSTWPKAEETPAPSPSPEPTD